MNFKIDFGNAPESREKLKELGVVWIHKQDILLYPEYKYILVKKSVASFFYDDDYLSFMNDENDQLSEEEFYSL